MTKHIARLAACALFCAVLSPGWAGAADTEETPASAATGDFDAARTLVDAARFDEALPLLRQLNQETPGNPDVLNLIGFSLRKTGHMTEALDYYNQALALNPKHLGANEYLGELYLETHQPEKAKERLEVLRLACGDCEEFEDLRAQIDKLAAQ